MPFASSTHPLKHALLAYAHQYGVQDEAQARRLAAQLWRALPEGLDARAAIVWLDQQVSNWAFALLGERLSAAEVRAAFLSGALDPLLLLRPHNGTATYNQLARQLEQARPMVQPPITPSVMPVQSLDPISLTGWMQSAASVSAVAVTARH